MAQPRPAKPNQTFGDTYDNYSSPQSVQPSQQRKSEEAAKANDSNQAAKTNNTNNGNNSSSSSSSSSSSGSLAQGLGGLGQIFTALSAIGVLLVGIIHIINLLEGLEEPACDGSSDYFYTSEDVDCLGKSLYWTKPDVNSYSSSLNDHWRYGSYDSSGYTRGPFTFILDYFFDNWTPIVFGVLACLQCIPKTRWSVISESWVRCMVFHLIMVLFCCFGYSGQAGILIGFLVSATGLICAICAFNAVKDICYPTVSLHCRK